MCHISREEIFQTSAWVSDIRRYRFPCPLNLRLTNDQTRKKEVTGGEFLTSISTGNGLHRSQIYSPFYFKKITYTMIYKTLPASTKAQADIFRCRFNTKNSYLSICFFFFHQVSKIYHKYITCLTCETSNLSQEGLEKLMGKAQSMTSYQKGFPIMGFLLRKPLTYWLISVHSRKNILHTPFLDIFTFSS